MNTSDDETLYSTQRAAAVLLVLAGMALQWAALHSITFLSTVFPATADLSGEAAGVPGAWTVNSACTFLTFLALFVASGRVSSLLAWRPIVPLTATCLLAGTAALVAGGLGAASVPLVLVGNALVALGTTPLIVVWGEVYKYLNPQNEQLLVTLGAIVLSVVAYLVEIHLPLPVAAAVFALMPLGSLFCLAKARATFATLSKSWAGSSRSAVRKSPALLYVCIVVFSIPYDYLRTTSQAPELFADLSTWSQVLSVTVVTMVAVALAEHAAEKRGVLLVPSLVLVLLTAALVLSLFPAAVPRWLTPGLLYAGYYLFLAMVYLALGPIVATTDANPARLFSGAMIANVGGLLLGTALGNLAGFLGESAATGVVLAITYAVFAAGLVLLNTHSYSIFRVNYYDENEYSFEYLVPLVPLGAQAATAASAPAGATPGERVQSMLDAIAVQCEAVAREKGLSTREHEVLVELVRGRTLTSIAQTFVVSENTVKAHTKAIYRKLDVHTREELLARVEGTAR